MDEKDLFVEIDDILRNIPAQSDLSIDTKENAMWLGRIGAVLNAWNWHKAVNAEIQINYIQNENVKRATEAYREVLICLSHAHNDLRMRTAGPANISAAHGAHFDYFDALRKIIETATNDIYFVDPYLDSDFVSKYLNHIKKSVRIRLLSYKCIEQLKTSVNEYCKQNKIDIEIREFKKIHDRYLFIDAMTCYHSGASFKDGPRNGSALLNQVTDVFQPIHQEYENIWNKSQIIYKN